MHHNLVLPNVMQSLKHALTDKIEEIENLHEAHHKKKTFDATPMPSCGESRESSKDFDIEHFEQEIMRNYQSKLIKATNIFLSAKWRSQAPLERFRSVVKAIVLSNRWKITTLIKQEESSEEFTRTEEDSIKKDNDHLHFNVEAFRVTTSASTSLSPKMKFILIKDPVERSPEELEVLFSLTNQMKCFAKYSPTVRRELAALMNFDAFEDGRIILKEGTKGISMYYIITGSVLVQIIQMDLRTGEKHTCIVHELGAGSSFGDLALVQDCIRASTIISNGFSQCVRIDKEDFELAIQRSYEKEWLDKLQMVKSIPYFSGWSGKDLRHIILNCVIQDYSPDTVILGNIVKAPENIYFVYSGTCKIVREVNVYEMKSCRSSRQTSISLPPLGDEEHFHKSVDHNDKRMRSRFLIIGQLTPGDYFGVGENLQFYYILALTRVECLVVPRHAVHALERILMSSRNVLDRRCNLNDMLKQAQTRLLSRDQIFEKWMTNLRWKNYRKKLMKNITERTKQNKKPVIPFRFKDFQLAKVLPSVYLPTYTSMYYPMVRRAGFINMSCDKFSSPVADNCTMEAIGRESKSAAAGDKKSVVSKPRRVSFNQKVKIKINV